jgi:hypothetical protein
MADQEWQFGEFPDQASAVSFLNADPKQGRGEASATLRNDGTVGLLYLEPGSLGADPSPAWYVIEESSSAGAVSFLNADPKQGPGEASATLRNDSTVGLLYLEPGSLGTDPSPAWYVIEESDASDTLSFLNADPRQGPGEASATPRSTGTVGLLYLEPGSLGAALSPSWLVAEFPTPQDAVNFLNAPPQQTAGEAAGFIRSDNSTVVFYLEP